jgi:hypothetical protein
MEILLLKGDNFQLLTISRLKNNCFVSEMAKLYKMPGFYAGSHQNFKFKTLY